MSNRATTKLTLSADGRLPTPTIAWPIAPESLARLYGVWRMGRVWLSLWNQEGQLVDFDPQGGRLWTTLAARSEPFTRQLGEYVRQTVAAGGAESKPDSGAPVNLGPWAPDLGLLTAPVRWRHRTVGMVVGAVVLTDRPGEALQRLCSQCALDAQTMTAFAAETGSVPLEQVGEFSRLLRWTVESTRETEVGREEIGVLTNNLENTYEELNLIYTISRQMRLSRKTSEVLQSVGADVLEVARAAGVAFVLREVVPPAVPPRLLIAEQVKVPSDRIVQVGQGAPDLQAVDRLAECLKIDPAAPASFVLINDAGARPEFAWARGWLKHLLALPLWHEQQMLGVLLAINCRDEGDFTSVDVQLLRAVADRLAAYLENQRLYNDLADLLMGLLHALVNSIDAKDPYTCGHSERVAFYSRALAREASLPDLTCERVYLAGLLHDVGKIGVPDAVLCKPGRLTNEEFDAMRKHPEVGARILSRIRQITDLLPGVLDHHERVDGRGYPQRLAGREIPLYGRIICLADCFDAMTTSRTYRTALPLQVAVTEIRRCSGTQFDPELAEKFLQLDLQQLAADARADLGLVPATPHVSGFGAALTAPTSGGAKN